MYVCDSAACAGVISGESRADGPSSQINNPTWKALK